MLIVPIGSAASLLLLLSTARYARIPTHSRTEPVQFTTVSYTHARSACAANATGRARSQRACAHLTRSRMHNRLGSARLALIAPSSHRKHSQSVPRQPSMRTHHPIRHTRSQFSAVAVAAVSPCVCVLLRGTTNTYYTCACVCARACAWCQRLR